MTSKTKNVTATEQIKSLTHVEKTPFDSRRRFLADQNTLPQSASNAALIEV